MRLKDLQEIVYKILQKWTIARVDDFALYGFVLKELGIDLNMSLKHFLGSHKSIKAPIFESVSRCRRKLQEKHPELAEAKMVDVRTKEQEKYIEWSRG